MVAHGLVDASKEDFLSKIASKSNFKDDNIDQNAAVMTKRFIRLEWVDVHHAATYPTPRRHNPIPEIENSQ